MTNTLAYYGTLLLMSVKSFITLAPWLLFASNGEALRYSTQLGSGFAWLGMADSDKHFSLLRYGIANVCKKFYNISPWATICEQW